MNWRVRTFSPLVDDEIRALPDELLARLVRLTETIERYGLEALAPSQRKHLEGKLWELRVRGKDGIARAIYVTVAGREVVILHAFQKKTQKTPKQALHLARERFKQLS